MQRRTIGIQNIVVWKKARQKHSAALGDDTLNKPQSIQCWSHCDQRHGDCYRAYKWWEAATRRPQLISRLLRARWATLLQSTCAGISSSQRYWLWWWIDKLWLFKYATRNLGRMVPRSAVFVKEDRDARQLCMFILCLAGNGEAWDLKRSARSEGLFSLIYQRPDCAICLRYGKKPSRE